MKIKKNGFYILKEEFFEKMQDANIPFRKSGIPIYCCLKDKNNDKIFWMVPLTTKLDKVNKAIEKAGGE